MTVFCTIYYILSYLETIPQVIKLIKTKSSEDYSLFHLCLQFLALLSWSIYIFTSYQSIVVYIGTVFDLLLLILVDVLIIRYYDNRYSNISSNK